MNDRFLRRESREEDVELIRVLKRNIADKEDSLKKMQDEKKYFQMELVNRENNFNKMFNTAPNIGFIIPLNAMTRPKPKHNGKSSPSLPAKLDPLPGNSPYHDLTLNPNKPLPKKFLS